MALRESDDRRVTAETPRVTLREMLGPVGKVGTGCALHHNARPHVMHPSSALTPPNAKSSMTISSRFQMSVGRRATRAVDAAAQRTSPRTRRGVTLTEMMIVVVLLGTVFAIGIPRLNASVRQRRVISAASSLSTDIPVAFSLAARQRKPVVLSYQAATGEMRVTDRATGAILLRRALRSTSEYMLDSVAMTPSSVQLFPNGVSSAAFTVRLANGSFVRQLAVGRTGFSRITVQ